MIGQFTYADDAPGSHVVLDLAWRGVDAVGRVAAPRWVVDILTHTMINAREHDEYMGLSLALSYGILVAAAAGAPLTITGDRTVWPAEWGRLLDAATASPIKSH